MKAKLLLKSCFYLCSGVIAGEGRLAAPQCTPTSHSWHACTRQMLTETVTKSKLSHMHFHTNTRPHATEEVTEMENAIDTWRKKISELEEVNAKLSRASGVTSPIPFPVPPVQARIGTLFPHFISHLHTCTLSNSDQHYGIGKMP